MKYFWGREDEGKRRQEKTREDKKTVQLGYFQNSLF
jgi:hypothetical protein